MDLPFIKNFLLDYFFGEFDHGLINDQTNDPYLHISLVTASAINPYRDSFGLYLKKQGRSATHNALTTANMAAALVLEAKYLLQKPPEAQPIIDIVGRTKGIAIGKDQVLIITVITQDPEDAGFISKTITNKVLALIGHG